MIRPAGGAPVAAIQLWFRAPSIGFEGPAQPGIARIAAFAVAASVPITGTPLGTLVQRVGGRFGIAVYPESIAISAFVPASQAAAVVRAMTAVFFTPVLTDAGLSAATAEVGRDVRFRVFTNPEDRLRDALFGELFASGPNHYSTYPDTLRPIGPAAARAFAVRGFRASNAVLVVTGAVDTETVAAAVEGPPSTLAGAEPLLSASGQLAAGPRSGAAIGPVPGFGFAWSGPAIANEAEATALDFIADYLFDPDSGAATRALGAADVTINAQYVTYHEPGVFFVEATGAAAAEVRAAIESRLAAMRTPLDPKVFAIARTQFEARIVADVQNPVNLAGNFGWFVNEGNPLYAPGADVDGGRYFSALRALTPASVAAVALKYLAIPPAVVVVTTPVPQTAPRAPSPAGSASATAPPAPATSPGPAATAPVPSPSAVPTGFGSASPTPVTR